MYSEPCQTSMIELLAEILTITAKISIIDVWQGPEYVPCDCEQDFPTEKPG